MVLYTSDMLAFRMDEKTLQTMTATDDQNYRKGKVRDRRSAQWSKWTNELKITWVSAHLVSRLLSEQAKSVCERYARQGERFLQSIITCDESWLHFYDPETMVWRHTSSPPSKKANVVCYYSYYTLGYWYICWNRNVNIAWDKSLGYYLYRKFTLAKARVRWVLHFS